MRADRTSPELTSQTSPSPTPEAATKSPERAAREGRFARLPLLAGKGFLPLGLFARLPLAMLTMGTLTLVTSTSSSFATGGAAAGAVGIGSALGAPVLGSLADRRGQRPVLLLSAVLNTVAVVLLIVAAGTVAPDDGFPVAVLAAAFAAGASSPQVGPLARVRWMALTARAPGGPDGADRDLDTALSYESTADEVTFVLGPALVGVLASAVAPWLPLALAAALTVTLVPGFAAHSTHRAVPVAGRTAAGRYPGSVAGGRMPWAVALPVAAMVCMGTFFGSTQAALSAFSAGLARAEIAGLLYAVMGLSSAVAALSVAYWPRRAGLALRWMLCAGLMAALAVLLLLPASLAGMAVVLLVLGLPVGPVMVTVFAVGGALAPARRLGTVMTGLASGIVAGTALGSSIGGQLAQFHGYGAAFLVPVCAAGALSLLGAGAAVVLRRRS